MASENGLSLSQLIRHVADELRAARVPDEESAEAPTATGLEEAKRDVTPVIELKNCELELSVAVKEVGKAGVQLHFFNAGYSGDTSTVSRIKLSFRAPEGQGAQYGSAVESDEPDNPPRKQKDG